MRVLALDIGGANLKAAQGVVNEGKRGSAPAVRSLPFALWTQPSRLASKLRELVAGWPRAGALAITMTAELCDCFTTRAVGVAAVLEAVMTFAGRRPVRVWSTQGRFISPDEAASDPIGVASANWHAQATWLARRYPKDASLVIDIGSTTTDITVIDTGRVYAASADCTRLERGELVYVGAFRTPLMAIPIRRQRAGRVPIMAERFATTADVYVLTKDQPAQLTRCDTADGLPLTRKNCVNRLLRMIGRDLSVGGQGAESHAYGLALEYSRGVDNLVATGVSDVLWRFAESRLPLEIRRSVARVIVAGSGDFIAARVARQLVPEVPQVSLRKVIGRRGSDAACAWALLQLWREDAKRQAGTGVAR